MSKIKKHPLKCDYDSAGHITLSDEDFDVMIRHLQEPSKPNDKLKSAFEKYKETTKGDK